MKRTILFSTLLVSAGLAFAVPAAKAAPLDDAQKAQVESVVHDYLMKNPQVIIDAVNTLQKAEYQKMQQKTQVTALSQSANLFHNDNDPVVGNPNGKVTLVEFFDYQCPHCVDLAPVVESLVAANPDLRVVLKDFPIRGQMSIISAKAAIAAQNQGKYWEFHQALMKNAQGLSEDKIYAIAKSVGLDVNKLRADMNSAATDARIKANYELAQNLQLMGTPAMFIAKTTLPKDAQANAIEFIPGQADQRTLQASIDKVMHG